MVVGGETFTDRRPAGRAMINDIRALVQLQQVGGAMIASIGGFDFQYCGGSFGEDGYRYMTVLARIGAETEIDLPVAATPPGAIARVELSSIASRKSSNALGIISPMLSGVLHPIGHARAGRSGLPAIWRRGVCNSPRLKSPCRLCERLTVSGAHVPEESVKTHGRAK